MWERKAEEEEKRGLVVRAVRVLGALEAQQLKHLTALVARVLLAIVLDAQPHGLVRAAIAGLGVSARARDDARVVAGGHQRRALARAERSDDRTHHVARRGICG